MNLDKTFITGFYVNAQSLGNSNRCDWLVSWLPSVKFSKLIGFLVLRLLRLA